MGRGHYCLASLSSNNFLEALVRLVYHSLSTPVTGLYYYSGSISPYENPPRHQANCFPSGGQKKLTAKFDTPQWVHSLIIHKELQTSLARYWRIIHSNDTNKEKDSACCLCYVGFVSQALSPLCLPPGFSSLEGFLSLFAKTIQENHQKKPLFIQSRFLLNFSP